MTWLMQRALRLVLAVGLLAFIGCGKDPAPNPENTAKTPADANSPAPPNVAKAPDNPATVPPTPSPAIKPLSLGALGGGNASTTSPSKTSPSGDVMNSVLDAMKPLQVFLGQWNTTTREKGAGSAKWIWDFQTDKNQPALVMSADGHPYFQSARLTFLTDKQQFQLTAKDTDGQPHVYQGKFTLAPHFITGDNGKPQHRFEMMLEEVGKEDGRKLVGVALNQQENNRLLMEVYRRIGKKVQLQDTVANQRTGTSFALSDTDYGEKECIVSQGLGTMAITFMGRTYYVCCSGCDAAFKDDPEFWITKAEERKTAEKK